MYGVSPIGDDIAQMQCWLALQGVLHEIWSALYVLKAESVGSTDEPLMIFLKICPPFSEVLHFLSNDEQIVAMKKEWTHKNL